MLKSFGFMGEGLTGSKYKKWKSGCRYADSWAYERDNEKRCIAPILVVWQAKAQDPSPEPERMELDQVMTEEMQTNTNGKKTKLDRKLFIRIHPSAFQQFWQELLKIAKMQKPQVLVEDLRFEVGSIRIQGPSSTEALVGVLKLASSQPSMSKVWPTMSSLNNPSSLPQNAMLAFSTVDPRLNHPPRQLPAGKDDVSINKLNELIIEWPFDNGFPSSELFEYKARYRISQALPTQKAINRRRTGVLPGQQLESIEKDPKIPLLLLAHRPANKHSNSQGSWTVLLPWSCVDLIWRSLMYYPLTSGSTPRFGGLEQTKQVAFEQATACYPGDYPGTEAGKAWDRTESESRFDHWVKRPPSKRVAWDVLDLGLGRKGELGRGWACDWEYLLSQKDAKGTLDQSNEQPSSIGSTSRTSEPGLLTQRQRKAAAAKAEKEKEKNKEQESRRRNTSSPESGDDDLYDTLHNDIKYTQLAPVEAASLFTQLKRSALPTAPVLATVCIKYLTKGTPKPAARIYRLPLQKASSQPGLPSGKHTETNAARIGQPDLLSTEHHPASFTPTLFTEPPPKSKQASIDTITLRAQWLALDPNPTSQSANPNSSTALPKNLGSARYNHSNLPTASRAYDSTTTRDLTHIRVFPPHETKAEVLNMFGPKPPPKTQSELTKLYVPQLIPDMHVNAQGELVGESLWDKHVPCPGPEDLIGFVTSGGYNLAEGAGTAVGALWAQRVLEGWMQESSSRDKDKHSESASTGKSQGTSSGTSVNSTAAHGKKTKLELEKERQAAKELKQQRTRVDRERHLCVVRNAGESIGRLAIWELC